MNLKKSKNLNTQYRYKVFQTSIIIIFVIIILRLFQIQVLNSNKYRAIARDQQLQGITQKSKRGNIYTKDGYPIAIMNTRYNLQVDTTIISNQDELFNMLIKYIPEMDSEEYIRNINSKSRNIRIATNISPDIKEKIANENYQGIFFEEDYQRIYPESTMLSHSLGFVGYDIYGEETGYYGIEQYYNGDLRGNDGIKLIEKSASGDPIIWGRHELILPVNGTDIYLTVDRNIQFIIEKELENGVKNHLAKSGTVIVIEPSTGAILALANYPNYNPSNYHEDAEDEDIFRNNAISSLYEPGSVMKALTMSAAIDSGIVTPNTIYNDTGPKYFSGYLVDNWDGKHHGEETMIEILQHSNNLGAAWVARKVGDKALINYLISFGFGSNLNVDMEGEEVGTLYTNFPLKEIELANAGFGQGISATPLQVAMAFSAIANDGLLMRPHVVEKLEIDGKTSFIEPSILNRPISEHSSEVMVDMLTQAVSGGEAKYFVSKKYNIAGKTGTAQVPIKGGYSEDKTNATFVGFLPSYRNFVLLVKLEEPVSPSGYAAETAVPLWMKIAENLANYYNLTPDKINPDE